MCQEAVRRLCNPSESWHMRKVARLLAQAPSSSAAKYGNLYAFLRRGLCAASVRRYVAHYVIPTMCHLPQSAIVVFVASEPA